MSLIEIKHADVLAFVSSVEALQLEAYLISSVIALQDSHVSFASEEFISDELLCNLLATICELQTCPQETDTRLDECARKFFAEKFSAHFSDRHVNNIVEGDAEKRALILREISFIDAHRLLTPKTLAMILSCHDLHARLRLFNLICDINPICIKDDYLQRVFEIASLKKVISAFESGPARGQFYDETDISDLLKRNEYKVLSQPIIDAKIEGKEISSDASRRIDQSHFPQECRRIIYYLDCMSDSIISDSSIEALIAIENPHILADYLDALITSEYQDLTSPEYEKICRYQKSYDSFSMYVDYIHAFQTITIVPGSAIVSIFGFSLKHLERVKQVLQNAVKCTYSQYVKVDFNELLKDVRLDKYNQIFASDYGHVFYWCPTILSSLMGCAHLDESWAALSLLRPANVGLHTAKQLDAILAHPNPALLSDIAARLKTIRIDDHVVDRLIESTQLGELRDIIVELEHVHSELIDREMINCLLIADKSMKPHFESMKRMWYERLRLAKVQPLDSAGRSVVQNFIEGRPKKTAANTIIRAWRQARYFRTLNSSEYAGGDSGLSYPEKRITLPKQFSYLLMEKIPPIFQTIHHGVKNPDVLVKIIHDGVIYSGDALNLSQLCALNDRELGDERRVCTSTRAVAYDEEWHSIELKLHEVIAHNRSTPTFKLCDWHALNDDTLVQFELCTDVEMTVEKAGARLNWIIKFSDDDIVKGTINPTDTIIHGYNQLDSQLTFLLFKIFASLTEAQSKIVYDQFSRKSPTDLIEHFQNFIRAFPYPELNFQQINLNMTSILAINHKNRRYDLDVIRQLIRDNKRDILSHEFNCLPLKELVHQSYFLVEGFLAYSIQCGSHSVSDYLRSEFSSALSLRDTMHLSHKVVPPVKSCLVNGHLLDQLNAVAITPSQLTYLLRHLKLETIKRQVVQQSQSTHLCFSSLHGILSELASISELGFVSTLQKYTVDNPAFRDLFDSEDFVFSLLCLMASQFQKDTTVSDYMRKYDTALFTTAQNEYTSKHFTGTINGIRDEAGVSRHGNFISDLLDCIPPVALMVPGNSNTKSKLISSEQVVIKVDFYHRLFQIIHRVAARESITLPEPLAREEALQERYCGSKWDQYRARFLSISTSSTVYDIGDRCEKFLESVSPYSFINSTNALSPFYSHFFLDTAHLASVLTSNYGDKKTDYFRIIQIIQTTPPGEMTFPMQVTALQLFYRLLLLEDSIKGSTPEIVEDDIAGTLATP